MTVESLARLDPRHAAGLIEELMIAANVAAAETLERLRRPCLYRVHDAPDPAKLAALREFLHGIGIPGLALAKGQVVKPRHFGEILRRAADTPYAMLVPQLVLRSQAQAVYSPMNIGHFGLALRRYAHFTSPIRRYADLLVHRGLIAALGLAGAAAEPVTGKDLAGLGEQVSMTERRAAAAERSAADRYIAAFLAERVGARFLGRINGVTRAGLFVTLAETGADGLVPMRSLPGDFYDHEESRHRLVGRRTRRSFTLGDEVEVMLAEADIVTGSLRFDLSSGTSAAADSRRRARGEPRPKRA
ncbi:MAG: RNB domain-containing ribonuclease [Stellaceae bacterium]